MTDPTVVDLLDLFDEIEGLETLDFEAKEAHGNIPRGFWETASAFANTEGGLIILGLKETDEGWKVGGVARPEHMKLELHTQFRNPQKISREVAGSRDIWIREIRGKHLVYVRINAVPRTQRPVVINNDRDLAFVRRDAGDFQCTIEELDRFRREAADEPADMRFLPFLNLDDFDHEAIARYRELSAYERSSLPHHRLDTPAFLSAIGAWRHDRAREEAGPTVAGILMFGKDLAIREIRPTHVIDYRRVPSEEAASRRWTDRVRWTGHLFGAWEVIFPRLTRGLPVPFRLHDLRRVDDPAGRETLREAFVNLLGHTDYQETADAPSIVSTIGGGRLNRP
jgi:predicted HTH transcriptional regulator